jgi:hypothetical protein
MWTHEKKDYDHKQERLETASGISRGNLLLAPEMK